MATVDTTGGTTLPRNNGATVVYGGNIDNSGTVTNAPSTIIFGKRKGRKGDTQPVGPTESNIGSIDSLGTARCRSNSGGGVTGVGRGGIFAYNPPANAPPGGRFVAMRVSTTLNAPAAYEDAQSNIIGLGTMSTKELTWGDAQLVINGGGVLMLVSGAGCGIGEYNGDQRSTSGSHVQGHGVGAHVGDIPNQYPLPYANPTQIHFKEGNYQKGVNTWDYVTGAITKGGTAGSRYLYHHASLSAHTDAVSTGEQATVSINATDRAARAKTNGGCGGWDVHPGRVTYNHGGYLPTSTYYNGVVWRGPGRSA